MLPFLREGKDVVELCDIDLYLKSNSLKKGDVILVRRYSGEFVLHRLCGEDEEGYWMKGDAEYFYEHRIEKVQLKGVMVGFYRGKRYVSADNSWYLFLVKLWGGTFRMRLLLRKLIKKAAK